MSTIPWRDLTVGLLAILALLGTASHAQDVSQEQRERYFGLYERLRQVTGSDQFVPILLLRNEDLMVWSGRDGSVRMVSLTGPTDFCSIETPDPALRQLMLQTLRSLSGPTYLDNPSRFPGGLFVSAEVTELLRGSGGILPSSNCTFDLYTDGSSPLGVLSPDRNEDAVGEVSLVIGSRRLNVLEGMRSWTYDNGNRDKLVSAIASSSVDRIIAYGNSGIVTVGGGGEVILKRWDGAGRIEFLPWVNAQTVLSDRRAVLFPDVAASAPSDNEAYLKLLGKSALGEKEWRPLVRQAPHIAFRKWL